MYRKHFDINPDELEIIESALRERAGVLSLKLLDTKGADTCSETAKGIEKLNTEMTEIQMLLGKLHNQKIWYAPKQYVPRG